MSRKSRPPSARSPASVIFSLLTPEMLKRLYDLGELRLREMDEAGIDMQILSHGAPSAQILRAGRHPRRIPT